MSVSRRTPEARSLSIVVPVYNEADNFPALWADLKGRVQSAFEVIVVYDMDEDSTIPVVKALIDQNNTNLRLAKNNVSRGVVGAIVTGFNQIESGPVLVVMADSCDDLGIIDNMLELYNQGADVVVGSRYMKGGRIVNGPWLKQGLSRLAGVSLHYLRGMPTHDVSNAFKIYDRAMLKKMHIESTQGFEINIEIAVKAFLHGHRFAEIPATWTERVRGSSRFQLWKWLPHYLRWYFYAFQPKRK